MKKTWSNIKKVYRYGKKYRKNLFIELFGSIVSMTIGIILPLFIAKQIVYFTRKSV